MQLKSIAAIIFVFIVSLAMPARADTPIIPADTFKLEQELFFSKNKTVKEKITQEELNPLSNEPIIVDEDTPNGYKASENAPVLRNCKDYWQYGLSEGNSMQAAMGTQFIKNCGTIKLLQAARPAQKKILQNFEDIKLSMLPASIITVAHNDEAKMVADYEKHHLSLNDMMQQKKLTVQIEYLSPHAIKLDYCLENCPLSMMSTILKEITKADFNGDGIEDFLISSESYIEKSSFRVYRLGILYVQDNKQIKWEAYNQ